MPRSQLAINCPQVLLGRLRDEAQQQRTTVTALVLAWLEAGLDGRLEPSRAASSSDLEQRLAAVEQRLDALSAATKPRQSPPPPIPKPTTTDGLLTTAALADHLGVKRHALNERLRRAGGAAIGLELEGWRIVNKARPAQGGPEQWQWRHV